MQTVKKKLFFSNLELSNTNAHVRARQRMLVHKHAVDAGAQAHTQARTYSLKSLAKTCFCILEGSSQDLVLSGMNKISYHDDMN